MERRKKKKLSERIFIQIKSKQKKTKKQKNKKTKRTFKV